LCSSSISTEEIYETNTILVQRIKKKKKVLLKNTLKRYTGKDLLILVHRLSEHYVSHPQYEDIELWERQKHDDLLNLLKWDLVKAIG